MTRQRFRSAVRGEWPDPHELIQRARELVRSIEGFVHLTARERRRINTAASLPDDFYLMGAKIIDQHEWLANAADLTGHEARRVVEESHGYGALIVELETLTRGVRSTLAARRAIIGRRLLLLYEIARRTNREGEEPYIKEIEYLERILRRRRHGGESEREPEPEPESAAE